MPQTMVTIKCSFCGCDFEKLLSEINRQLKKGRDNFFCGRSCGAKYNNEIRGNKRHVIEKTCPFCEGTFETLTGSKSATFCSPSCASKGSVTDKRRNCARKISLKSKKNLISVSQTLKRREAWKYVKLKKLLTFLEEPYEFEKEIGKYVFDLALIERKILIEFDGDDHSTPFQKKKDRIRDKFAKKKGWKVKRVSVKANLIIPVEILYDIL